MVSDRGGFGPEFRSGVSGSAAPRHPPVYKPSLVVAHIPEMGGAHDCGGQSFIKDVVDDAVVPDTDTPGVPLTDELFAPCGLGSSARFSTTSSTRSRASRGSFFTWQQQQR
ncbi:hypothetical protein [Devriesea agamarum]